MFFLLNQDQVRHCASSSHLIFEHDLLQPWVSKWHESGFRPERQKEEQLLHVGVTLRKNKACESGQTCTNRIPKNYFASALVFDILFILQRLCLGPKHLGIHRKWPFNDHLMQISFSTIHLTCVR